MEPRVRPNIEEFLRVCNGLLEYLTDEECEEMACIKEFSKPLPSATRSLQVAMNLSRRSW